MVDSLLNVILNGLIFGKEVPLVVFLLQKFVN